MLWNRKTNTLQIMNGVSALRGKARYDPEAFFIAETHSHNKPASANIPDSAQSCRYELWVYMDREISMLPGPTPRKGALRITARVLRQYSMRIEWEKNVSVLFEVIPNLSNNMNPDKASSNVSIASRSGLNFVNMKNDR